MTDHVSMSAILTLGNIALVIQVFYKFMPDYCVPIVGIISLLGTFGLAKIIVKHTYVNKDAQRLRS